MNKLRSTKSLIINLPTRSLRMKSSNLMIILVWLISQWKMNKMLKNVSWWKRIGKITNFMVWPTKWDKICLRAKRKSNWKMGAMVKFNLLIIFTTTKMNFMHQTLSYISTKKDWNILECDVKSNLFS